MRTICQDLIHYQKQLLMRGRRIKTKITILMNYFITNWFGDFCPNRIFHCPQDSAILQCDCIKRTIRGFKIHRRSHQHRNICLLLLPYYPRFFCLQINGIKFRVEMRNQLLLTVFISPATQNVKFITHHSYG